MNFMKPENTNQVHSSQSDLQQDPQPDLQQDPQQQNLQQQVQDYYGQTLQQSSDLQTNACCTGSAPPSFLKIMLANIHDEVLAKYYGCGLILPPALEGCSILDLGCGAGRDVYILSQMVGESGRVIGVDMTPEQLDVARQHQDYHCKKFGFSRSNVEFIEGTLENLASLNIEKNSIDVIVSNCVINLCADKPAVLRAAFDLLKPGGELYFSDVYADRRMPQALKNDPVLWGECLSGAFYWNDFLNTAKTCGFLDPRLVESSAITVENPELEQKLGNIRCYSATYRLFKLPALEPACEDYGQAVIYRGGIANSEEVFILDGHHTLEKGRIFPVCGNTWRMLQDTRLRPYFDFIGDPIDEKLGEAATHYGIFPGCGSDLPFDVTDDSSDTGSCC